MYLSGSKWSMTRKKRPSNPLRLILLVALVGAAIYVNQVVVPVTPPLFVSTPTPTRSPDSFINEALTMVKQGKFTLAEAAYQQAIQANPKNINIYLDLARQQVLYGKFDSALENTDNALLLNNNNSLAHAVRGWAMGRKGDYLPAEAELRKAIEIDPGNALAYAYYAEVLAQQQTDNKGDLTTIDKMIEMSRKAQQNGPDLMETHRSRGLVLEVTSNYSEAITELEAALTINDNLADLHLALGRNYKAVDPPQYDKAIEQFNRAIALKPDDPLPYLYTARTYLTAGEFAKAIQYANQAIQQDPTDPLLYANLGTMLYRLGSYPEAVVPLRLATRGGVAETGEEVKGMPMDGTTVEYYARYGLALAHTSQCGEALQISQTILQAFPTDETNAYNANAMTELCRQVAQGTSAPQMPSDTATPEPGASAPNP